MRKSDSTQYNGVFIVLGRRGYVLNDSFIAGNISSVYQTKISGPRRLYGVIYEIFQQLYKHIKNPYRHVVTDSVEYVPIAWLISKFFKIQLIILVRGDVWAEFKQTKHFSVVNRWLVCLLIIFYEKALRDSHSVVPVCDYLSSIIVKNAQVNVNKIRKIPISVPENNHNETESRSKAKKICNFKSKKILLSVTNFRYPRKINQIKKYLPILKTLLERDSNLLYVVAGDGAHLNEFKKKVQSTYSALTSQILFLGHVKNMNRLYNAADLILYFTALDALPRAVIEAQNASRVVIADNNFGIPEIIEHKKTGYLLNYKDDLQKYIIELMNNHTLSKKIENSSKIRAKKIFSPRRVGLLWQTHLYSMLKFNND